MCDETNYPKLGSIQNRVRIIQTKNQNSESSRKPEGRRKESLSKRSTEKQKDFKASEAGAFAEFSPNLKLLENRIFSMGFAHEGCSKYKSLEISCSDSHKADNAWQAIIYWITMKWSLITNRE